MKLRQQSFLPERMILQFVHILSYSKNNKKHLDLLELSNGFYTILLRSS